MKQIKKILALVLAFAMVLSISACGSSSETTTTKAADSGEAATEAAAEETTEIQTGLVTTALPNGTLYKTGESDTAEKKTDDGVLVVGTNKAIEAAQPCNTDTSDAQMVIYDRLFDYDAETGEYLPSLATEWSYTDDTHFDLTIRDDVVFHNGEKLTIEDVIYTLETLTDQEKCSKWYNLFAVIDVENIEIVDDYHCIIPFSYSWDMFESYFSMNWAGIICKSYMEKNPDSYWEAPNGTGPFKQTEIISGDRVVLEANEDYWGELPTGYDKIIVKYYSDPSTMYIDYEAGNLDVVYYANAEDIERVLNGECDHTNLQIVNADVAYCLGLWQGNEYFKDAKVREAVAYALDYEVICDIGLGILGTPADSILVSSSKYAKHYEDYPECDTEKAKELLKEAGYENGFEFTFGCNSNAIFTAMADVIQGMLSEVGITMNIETYDASALVGKLLGSDNNGVPEVDAWFWTKSQTSRDPVEALSQFEATEDGNAFAIGAVTDEKIGQLLQDAKTAPEDEKIEMYDEIQDYLCGTYILQPIGEYNFGVIYRDYVEDWIVATPKGDNLANINLK